LVINGLRAFGKVPPITHNIPPPGMRPAGSNGKTDFLGHGLIEIYLNNELSTFTPINNYIKYALEDLQAPPKEAATGFLTATLTWNGQGDVDLHVFEPNGKHVYFVDKQGTSGLLDVDNVVGFGPEHYTLGCDKSKIQTGIYQIKVANYKEAQGKTATVNISTNQYGSLAFKQVKLGDETGSNPVYAMFNVNIFNDNKGHLQIELVK